MSDSKIEIKIGEIAFSGEGTQDWLSEQLDKILDRAKDLMSIMPSKGAMGTGNAGNEEANLSGHNEISSKPLAVWLKSKNAETVQTIKFLATAVWVEAKGKKRIKTSDVTSALKNANQKRLGNPSDCLNQNVTKGFCEKDGNEFYVTEEGKRSLGIN